MANKFSIAVKVKDNDVVESVIVHRSQAEKAITAFKGWRDEGYEAYLFNSPEADKRCKASSVGSPSIVEQVVSGFTKKKSKAVQSIDIE